MVCEKARTGEWDDRVRNIFQQRAFAHGEFIGLHGRQSFWARPVDSRRAGGGQLHARASTHIYFQRELITAEQSAGNIVQVRERCAVLNVECTNNFERRLLVGRREDGLPGIHRARNQASGTLAAGRRVSFRDDFTLFFCEGGHSGCVNPPTIYNSTDK